VTNTYASNKLAATTIKFFRLFWHKTKKHFFSIFYQILSNLGYKRCGKTDNHEVPIMFDGLGAKNQ